MKITSYRRVSSTNDRAHALAKQGAPDWTVVVSDVQTRGRGRAARKWRSPKGGLWFSVILRPEMPTAKLALLQFLASNAVRRVLETETGVHAQVKWPNDLVLESGKLGGILVESKSVGERVSYAIVGIGLNVNLGREHLPAGATSVYLSSGRKHDLGELLVAIVESMESGYSLLERPAGILDEWWRNCIHRSGQVSVETPKGTVNGVSIGVEPEGFLLVQTEKGVVERLVEGTLRVLGG